MSSRAHARSKSFCDSPNSTPRKTRTTPCLMLTLRSDIALFRSIAIFPSDRDAILNDLHTHAEFFGFWIRVVHAHDFVVHPNAQVALLLEEIEKLPWLRSRGDCDPERDKNIFAEAVAQNLLRNRLRCFRSNFTAATRTERVRDTRPEKFQVIVDLRHCADGRARSLDGVRLLNGDCGRDAADIVNARLVHSIEELPHVRTERFDVPSLAFSVNRLEGQTRFAAAARASDDGQFSQRKIDIDPFKVVLARAANLNAIIPRRSENASFFPELRTHWRQFQIAGPFANSGERTLATVLVAAAISFANSLHRKTAA